MKIVITGPESVGKSTLVNQLGKYFKDAISYKEFARSYVENQNGHYNYTDIENIAKEQLNEYDKSKDHEGIVLFDTFLIVTKVWFKHVYNKLPEWFEEELLKRPVDLFLLCEPDIPWVYDPVRENCNDREFFFNLYRNEIESYGYNYQIIRGQGKERTLNAIEIVENYKKQIYDAV